MTIQSGNDKERAASWIRAKAGTIATVVLLVGVVTAAVVSATPGSRPEVEDRERSKAAERTEATERAERDGKPSKVDLEARKAAFLEDLAAKVDAGELTRAEAGEVIARMEDRFAEGAKRDGKPSKAA